MKHVLWPALMALAGCGFLGFGGSKSDDVPEASYSAEGSVCGNPALKGTAIGAVEGPGACGIPSAVSLTEVAGVALSTPARIDCETATSLLDWVENGVKPAVGRRGGGVASLKVAASYSCRTRNHRAGARLSEHSYGHAIDISALTLRDGTQLTVLNDWNGSNGPLMRELHSAACGPFGTVLGPKSDRHHQDHFHFDTARYRSGPYCR